MGKEIVNIKKMGDALRNTGYKNIESAVSEIVDNSIEAGATENFIILNEDVDSKSGRKIVSEMAFLDNGSGMDKEILGGCLGIGMTTREQRKGMGRFGVGLPQASLYACPRVEVYSWQNGIENCRKVVLDINMVKKGEQTELEDPCLVEIPDHYREYINYKTKEREYDFSKSGTLVVWMNCDRVSPKTRGPLITRLEFALGQKFRYFITKGISKIRIIAEENQDTAVDVYPNDPLFLMSNNYVLGNPEKPGEVIIKKESEGEPYFEPFTTKDIDPSDGSETGVVYYPVKYYDKNGNVAESTVTLKFSIVKSKFYDETAIKKGSNPGDTKFGKKYARRMEGISVVRANREIDFGKFDFYENINEPTHRWWGCEIQFTPELDEAFGVANNKQYVDLKHIEQEDIDDQEEVKPMWVQLRSVIENTIKKMYDRNKETRKQTRSSDDIQTTTVEIINDVEKDSENDSHPTSATEEAKATTSEEERISKGKEELEEQGVENPTDADINRYLNNKVNFKYKGQGKFSPFFDYTFELGYAKITINTNHAFYTSFLSKIYEDSPEAQVTFELFLASFVKSVDDTYYQESENDILITTWHEKLNKYIREQLNPRKPK